MTRIKERSRIESIAWYRCDEIIHASIDHAINGDSVLLKEWLGRLLGKLDAYMPIVDRLDEIAAGLPEDWDVASVSAAIAEKMVAATSGPWTRAEAEAVGRLGVETLKRRAKRGDVAAASILAKVYIPDPILSLGEQAATMTPEQLRDTMIRRYSAAWSWLTQEDILRMVDAIQAPKEGG